MIWANSPNFQVPRQESHGYIFCITAGSSSFETVTAEDGTFGTGPGGIGYAEILHTPAGPVFPITVVMDGFGTGYAKVAFVPGRSTYTVDIVLEPVSDTIEETDDVTTGVDIQKDGQTVGELTIPEESFPDGVTRITGSITYIDPTTPSIGAFPGGDFLALPESADPNDPPVLLESFGLMAFDLVDQNGNPVTDLAGPATVCMRVPDALAGVLTAGDTVPLWHYDPALGIWVGEGEGIVEDRGTDGLWMCGEVFHFTWWNYDRPIEFHACFKFQMVNKDTGTSIPTEDMAWFAEGIGYAGESPSRPCACDGDDPRPPCTTTGGSMDSFTVKRSDATVYGIHVYTRINGLKYYLQRVIDPSGDVTLNYYRLIADPAQATVFDTPQDQGSCVLNEDVDRCRFLDELDPVDDAEDPALPQNGDNGILPVDIAGINLAPRIEGLFVPEGPLNGAPAPETVQVEAWVSDPDDDDVAVEWTASCGTLDNANPEPGVFSSIPVSATADFTAPAQTSLCRITVTATDTAGNVSRASAVVAILGENPTRTVQGTLFGPDGAPAAGVEVTLTGSACWTWNPEGGSNYAFTYHRTVTTGADGGYTFDDVPCCVVCPGGWYGGLDETTLETTLETTVDVAGTPWTYRRSLYGFYCCGDGEFEGVFPLATTPGGGDCTLDIHFPTLWATLRGSWFTEAGEIDTTTGRNLVLSRYVSLEAGGEMTAQAAFTDGEYGPVSVPLGELYLFDDPFSGDKYFTMHQADQSIVLDFGPGATAIVAGTLWDDDGAPIAGAQVMVGGFSTETDAGGMFSVSDLPTGLLAHAYHQPGDFTTLSLGAGLPTAKDQAARADILGRGCTLTGTLYDHLGAPASGQTVELYVQWGGWNSGRWAYVTTTTGTDGRFSFEDLGTGGTWPQDQGLPTGLATVSACVDDGFDTCAGYAGYFDIPISESGGTVTVDLQASPPPSDCNGGYYPAAR